MTRKFPILTGTNIAGAEWVWNSAFSPKEGTNYQTISNQDADYLHSKGMNFGRFLFSWELMQPTLNGNLSLDGYANVVKAKVDLLTNKGLYVMLEPHGGSSANFVRYKGNVVGSAAVPNSSFADFWTKMAVLFQGNPRVIFGLGNEPNNIGTMQWFDAAQAAITGIRSVGSTNFIMVNGNGWSQPGGWNDTWYDTSTGTKVSNATGWSTLKDPINSLIVSVHAYFDKEGGGNATDIVSTDIICQRLQPVLTWARSKGLKVHLSEFGCTATAPGAQAAVAATCNFLKSNSDVFIGWAWWAYGPPSWWGSYDFTLCPKSNYTVDDAKMVWLKPFLSPMQNPADYSVPVAPPPTPTGSQPTNPITFTKGSVLSLSGPSGDYWTYVPESYDSTHKTPMSLFVWLHGCGGKSQYDISMVSPGGTSQKWISLAPGGREGACWSSVDADASKVLGAIADLRTKFNIDPKRIILGGYSSGGDIGYPLMFRNANLFAGGLFENTAPSATAMADSTKAAWKLNIAHLSHTSDTTYPIANVKNLMNTLKANGFPVTFIEKPGTHWDNDNGTTGTKYDLKTFLMPFLDAGWIAGGSPVVPAIPPIEKTTTSSKSPGDQGKNFTKIDDTISPGTVYTLKTAVRSTFGDQTSFKSEFILMNDHIDVDFNWKEMVVDTRGHTIQSVWGATVSSPDAAGLVIIIPNEGTAKVRSQNRNSFGMYVKRSSDESKSYYQLLIKSIKW